MAQDLGASGLDERLVAAARAAGYDRLTPLQESALPVLRRGGNVVLHASSGAGVSAAYGLPLLDRLLAGGAAPDSESGGQGGPKALVIVPSDARVAAVAEALARLADGTGITVRATAVGWRVAGADVVVTTAPRALRDLQGSALKLDEVQTLVIADLSEQLDLAGGEALETITGLVPRAAQRVVTTARLDGGADRFIDAHVRRALTVPPRPADPAPAAQAAEPVGQIGYLVLAEAEKPELLARLLEGVEGEAVVRVRSAVRADEVRSDLRRRGMAEGDDAIRVLDFAADDPGAERVLSCDVPFSADELRRLHEGGGTVFVTPAELQHFRRIAAEVPFTLKQRRARQLERSGLDAFRDSVRAALDAEDLPAQLLVLDPLFDEHSPAEVAAALSALLRRRAAAASPGSAVQAEASAAPAGPPPAAGGALFTRLFMSVGARDAIRPGDVVGAITGEAGIRGEQVGRVDIRESFSVVEVAADVADRVIRALNGTTMRGRSLRVDYDRKTGSGDGGGRPPRKGGPPRAGAPRGPGAGGGGPRRRPPAR